LLPSFIAASGVLYSPDKNIEGKVRKWQVGGVARGFFASDDSNRLPKQHHARKDKTFQGHESAVVS
jgi:hypothetical protein